MSAPRHTLTTGPAARPELTRDELQQLRWLLGGILTLLGVATVAYMDVEGGWLMALAAVVALLTTLNPRWPARLPRRVHLLAFPVMAGFFALDLWLRSELLPAMVRLDLLLLLYRALVYRKRRDDLQVIVLGLFLVVVAGVLTVSLLFAVHLVVYTAGALALLLLLTLIECSPAAETTAPPGNPPSWALHPHWGRLLRRVAAVADWRVVAVGIGLFAGVIATSALLFLLIPRFQLDNGMFLDRFVTRKARTGFSDSIRFGDVTEIRQDTGVALHVDVGDPSQIPLAPYWRMLVLDHYENGAFRLSPPLRLHRFNPPRTGAVVFGAGRWRRDRTRWTVYLEPGVSRYLPLLGPYPQLKFAEPQTYQNAPGMALLALVKEPVTMTAYQVEAFDLSARPADPPAGYFSEEASSVGLRPDEIALLRQLVREAVPGNETPATGEFAERLGAWLRERHGYSLSPRVPSGNGDPLVRWIDSREVGHCELFAGSFVLLARAAGFRARVVTGFRGGTWNAFSNSFTIRNSDAHAWAEIFDHATGSWLRADPLELPAAAQSDPAVRDGVLARRTDRSWSARLDSLRVFWYRRVVSFDEQTQVQTLKVAKELAQSGLEGLKARLAQGAAAVKAWWRRPLDARRVGLLLAFGAGATAAGLGWRRLRLAWLRSSFWRRPGRRDDPIRREAGRWLRRLAVPPDRVGAAGPVVAELQRLRFGPRRSWPDAGRVFRDARTAAGHRPGSRDERR